MAKNLTALAGLIALAMTLALPIYPEGVTAPIAAFFGLVALAGLFGLADRRSRYELAIMAPWAAALVLGVLVGSVHQGESQQAIEDAVPYVLFVLGLSAGRGIAAPRLVLRVGLVVCVADSLVSMWLMDGFGAGMRSTFNYFKITAGLPLVGLYLSAVLRHQALAERRAWVWPLHGAAVTILVAGIVFSVTRGMLIGWLLGVVVAAQLRKPSQVLLGAMVVLLGLLVWSTALAELGTEYLRFGQESTIEGRFREVEIAVDGFVAAPMFGQGLGALADVDGFKKAFVHNLVAYHLWKFGLIGCTLLVIPLVAIARELRRVPRALRSYALGGAAGVLGYLVTCAAYKTYYLVWIYGLVVGASLTWFDAIVRARAAARTAPAPTPAPRTPWNEPS